MKQKLTLLLHFYFIGRTMKDRVLISQKLKVMIVLNGSWLSVILSGRIYLLAAE